MQEPYYGIILSSMNKVPTKEVGTCGVRRSGNVFTLGYNPDDMDKLPLDTVMTILKHECLHLCFGHLTLWPDDKFDSPMEHKLKNIAEDLEVNCYIDRSKTDGIAPVFAEAFGFQKCLGAKEYLRLLKEMQENEQEQEEQATDPDKPCNGGAGGENGDKNPKGESGEQSDGDGDGSNDPTNQKGSESGQGQQSQQSQQSQQAPGSSNTPNFLKGKGEVLDDHSQWPDDAEESEVDAIKAAVDDIMVLAAAECEKSCGEIPAELKIKIDLMRRKARPVADWKRYFRRYLGNEFTDEVKKSKKRRSKRFPDAAGNRHKRKSNILVAIDTSGSINMEEYKQFFGQIKTLSEKANLHVVECDSTIQYEYDFKGKLNEHVHGGGGTSFVPPIRMFLKNRKKYDAIVYFTDGCATIPRDTPKEMLWVVSSDGDKDAKKYKVNGASVVFIKPKQQ